MKEKTKQILRYVACGLGGLALGIGLLGGLSMCATSNKKQTEAVNTILTTEKVRHNAKTTTANGGYDKYYFNVLNWLNGQTLNTYDYRVFHVNYSTYALSLARSSMNNAMSTGYWSICEVINNVFDAQMPTEVNSLDFLVIEGYTEFSATDYRYWYYFSFMDYHNGSMQQMPFYLLSDIFRAVCSTSSWTTPATHQQSPILLNTDRTDIFLTSYETAPQSGYNYHFQDMVSYLKEEGYTEGHTAGYSEGNTAGYSEGHTAGYSEGHTAGYESGFEDGNQEGYDNGYQDGNEHGQAQGYEDGYNDGLTDGLAYGQEFTTYKIMTQDNNGGTYWPSYGWDINNNAPAGMYGDFSSSTYQIANLLQYKTEDNDLHLIYLMRPIEGAITGNEYFGHCYIYQYNQTDSTLEDTLANGLMYYQAAADHYGWDYAHIFWTSGGTRNISYGKVTGIYNDSLQKGYIQLSGQITDQNVYDTGYQAGLLAGQQNSNMNNVFSLLTGAFDACASFFNLRIFGFLPLYWFFLAPLFVALITLLLRMVKH